MRLEKKNLTHVCQGLTQLINMHIFVLRGSVYPIVMKTGKQFYIGMIAHLTGYLILNSGHMTRKRLKTI